MRASEHPHSTASKFRLLYLGNDLEFIAALRQVLTEPDYRLLACSDREGAELFLKSDIRYDLMLIDFDWRRREGLELARLAQSLAQRIDMPIVMVAATPPNSAVKTLAQKAGVKKCVTKTPDAGVVNEVIRQLVESGPQN
ncbi:MAG TPA: response regulator, partial [Pyrinomonadaceae bacterium]|nr:response regulator [Pyrinomonadaceae bacterium]